ncbi:hypothetical protein U0C82_18515 [Fulvimarina sp. 2208YS6-2-32]|uniref:Uncharacterized protein n=1 Tax=Fulvimarina uroteuthidis TaxID=3098149 RepID=A0ABU5I6V6_9HYPH|nr:hypothetical protein [Fulvimarina sp. 2208YS6-2-32]MDY8111118.1 hypothetical protein [Fulvimarina sp. 2208YS6-2-32]
MSKSTKTIADLIAERTALYEAHIASGTPDAPNGAMPAIMDRYDAMTSAWQSAPCQNLEDIMTKAHFVLKHRNVLDTLRDNEGELERFLGSFTLAKETCDLDRQDAIDTAYNLMEAVILMAQGMGLDSVQMNALAHVAEAAQNQLDKARS